jgi:hypothetical protein
MSLRIRTEIQEKALNPATATRLHILNLVLIT